MEIQNESYEYQFNNLSIFEKNIINKTSLSIEDIYYYEELLSRKLTKRELTLAALLRNNGALLIKDDFNI